MSYGEEAHLYTWLRETWLRGLTNLCHAFPNFVRPDLKALQTIWAERGGDCDVRRIPASRNEYAPDARDVVACIESVPGALQIDFEPGREIHHAIRRWRADVTKISGAVARGN